MNDPQDFVRAMAALVDDQRQQKDAFDIARDEAKAWDDFALAWINNQPPVRGVSIDDADAIEAFANEMVRRRRRSLDFEVTKETS